MACAVLETNIAHAATVAYANKTLLRISILRAVFPTNSSLALYGRGATPLLQRRYFPHISVCYNLFFSPITAPRFIVATNPHIFSASGTIFCIALFRYRSIRALLFRPFAHLRRQRRHACGGNVPEYAPAPPWASFLVSASNWQKSAFCALFRPTGSIRALYRPISLSLNTGSGAAMCSFHSAHTPRYFRAIERYRTSRRQGYRIDFFH